MAPTAFYGWTSPDLPKELTVDCFLPTGVLIPLECKVNASLAEIKTNLFKTAQNYPLFNRLKEESNYCFLCINEKGKRETFLDESLKLTDVRPFRPVLKLLEKQGDDKGDSKLDAKIKFLMRQTPAELEGNPNEEVINFRQVYLKISLDDSRERRKSSWEERAASTYPSDVCMDPVPEYVSRNLRNGKFDLIVYLPPWDDFERLEIPTGINPSDVVYVFRNRSEKRKMLIANDKDFVLKIVGKDDYLLGNYNMENYQTEFVSNVAISRQCRLSEFTLTFIPNDHDHAKASTPRRVLILLAQPLRNMEKVDNLIQRAKVLRAEQTVFICNLTDQGEGLP